MAFSLPRFLRRTPAASLRHYFACRQISPFAQFAWDSEHADFLGALRQEIEALDDETRGQVFVDFERVDQLCDPVGQTAVYSFAATDSLLLSRIQAAECNESRGLVLLLHDEEMFDRALACSYADRRQSGRSWSCYSLATCATAMNDNERLKTLESEISGLLRQFDGTGRRLKVDYFDRQRKLAAGPTVGSVAHYCIYAEGLPETRWEFEQAEPTRHTWRPVHEGAISYSPTSSSLEVIAKGGRSVRSKIAHSYARQILGIQDHLAELPPRKFVLGRLKKPLQFVTEPADGIKSVCITMLCLQNLTSSTARVTLEIDGSGRADIHTSSAIWFGESDPLQKPEWRVSSARLRIVFFAEKAERRDKVINVELRTPNGSNLKEHIERHHIIAEKYLVRWGLIEGQPEN